MPANRETVLCRYHYDPLDRLVVTTSTKEDELQRFYCKSRLATEIQGLVQRSIFQQDDQLLAQRQLKDGVIETSLLATDQQRSVLQTLRANPPRPIAYSPYGHRPAESGLLSLLGFNGERPDPVTGYYLLGNGYRAFNPVLMRFNSPDSLSPFGMGGLNSYTYCLGDPINRYDESGHFALFKQIRSLFRLKKNPKTFDIGYKKSFQDELHNMFMKTKHMEKEPTIRHIKSRKDLGYLGPGDEAKFVFTKDKKLITGKLWSWEYKVKNNLTDMMPIHHGSLTKNEKSTKVISAGYIKIKPTGETTIDNHSGHYRPTFESLIPVKKYMEKNNIAKNITLIRQDIQ